MKLDIASKAALLVASLIVITAAFLGWLFVWHETRTIESDLEERVNVTLDNLAYNIRYSILATDRETIAQSLEISTSKAGVMVNKLLESNPAFEEVREGRLRRIRFRGEE